jgi:hypothetical protein
MYVEVLEMAPKNMNSLMSGRPVERGRHGGIHQPRLVSLLKVTLSPVFVPLFAAFANMADK